MTKQAPLTVRDSVAAHNRKPRPNPAELRQKYHGEWRTLESLAQEHGVSVSTLWDWFREAGIPRRKRGYRKPIPPRDELYRLYHDEGLTLTQLVSRYRTNINTVTRWLESYGIQRRKGAPPSHLRGREEELLRLQTEERLHPTAIARRLGVDRHAVSEWITKQGLQPHPAPLHPPWPVKDVPPLLAEADLRRWYLEDGLSPAAIAARTDYAVGTIKNYLERYGIPTRDHRAAQARRRRLPPDLELRRLYYDEGRTVPDIARAFGVSELTVASRLRQIRRPDDLRTVPRAFTTTGDSGRASAGRSQLTREMLERLYLQDGRSVRAVGRALRVSDMAVRYRLKKYGLPLRPRAEAGRARRRRPPIPEEQLWDLYEKQGLSLLAIARQAGVVPNTVMMWLARYGIPRRSKSDALRLARQRPDVARRFHRTQAPTGPERRLNAIISRYELPFRYVGDWSLVIDGHSPDFIGTEDSQAIIEVFGERFHPSEPEHRRSKQSTEQFYGQRGYRVLVIWARELTYPKRDAEHREAEVVRRIRQFVEGQPAR